MKTILTSILVINLLDLISTIYLVQSNLAVEANPFMALLLHNDVYLFAAIKIFLVSCGVWIIHTSKNQKFAIVAAWIALIAYLYVVLTHFNVFIEAFGG